MTFTFLPALCALAVVVGVARAESHTIKFVNNCGTGVPTIVTGGQVMSTSDEFTIQGPLQSSIGYLNTGCLLNGEKCVLLEMNINNPTCPGCGPSVDLSLIQPHTFNVPTAFQFFGGTTNEFGTAGSCDGLGAFCADASCSTAFHNPDDTQTQRACQLDNINLLVTFCGTGPSAFTPAIPGSLSNIASQPNPSPPAQPKPATTSSSVAATETHAPPPASSSVAVVAPPASKSATPQVTSSSIVLPVAPIATTPVPVNSVPGASSSAPVVAPPPSKCKPPQVTPASIVLPVVPIATAPLPVNSAPGATSNTSSPPSRSGTKVCKNKRRRRGASAIDVTLSLKRKRTGAGAHARAQDRARSLSGLAHL